MLEDVLGRDQVDRTGAHPLVEARRGRIGDHEPGVVDRRRTTVLPDGSFERAPLGSVEQGGPDERLEQALESVLLVDLPKITDAAMQERLVEIHPDGVEAEAHHRDQPVRPGAEADLEDGRVLQRDVRVLLQIGVVLGERVEQATHLELVRVPTQAEREERPPLRRLRDDREILTRRVGGRFLGHRGLLSRGCEPRRPVASHTVRIRPREWSGSGRPGERRLLTGVCACDGTRALRVGRRV